MCAFAVSAMVGAAVSSVAARTQPLNLDRQYPILEAENNVWIGTPAGLFQYNPGDDAFRRLALPPDAPGGRIRDIHYSDEWLWCVLDSGLAALHIRSNDWLFHDDTKGLPSRVVNSLAFHEDYAWVATDRGAARYDMLIEEWEVYDETRGIPAPAVNEVLVKGDEVWLVTDRHLWQYDPRFEKWRHYEIVGGGAEVIRRAFLAGEDIWLVSDSRLIRFDTKLETQHGYNLEPLLGANLLDLLVDEKTIWAVTALGLYRYDQTSGVWREFEGNTYLTGSRLVNAFVDGPRIWVLTAQSVMVWDGDEKTWEILDYASGLSRSGYEGVYSSGGMVFLAARDGFDYRTSAEAAWRSYDTGHLEAGRRPGGRILSDLFDNEEGGFIQLGGRRWGWDGTRITLIQDYARRLENDGDGGEDGGGEIVYNERLDVKSRLDLGRGRGITGYYNDVDYSETMYGAGYRSREDEILREVVWGDFRREPGSIPFGESSSLFGTEVWLQAGSKTERYKRSLVTVKGQYAERRSRKTYEHFEGANTEFETSFRDLDYARNEFYLIPGLAGGGVPEMLEVFVDDLNPNNSTPNTLEHHSIAGVTGDFDLLRGIEDYYFYEKAEAIRFTGYVGSAWTVVVRYSTGETVFEEVLQHGAISAVLRNLYHLQGAQIIPHSFHLSITDSLSAVVMLSEFGIDADGDGMVDSDWIDYAGGILMFPEMEPFPPEVYDPVEPRSLYRLHVDFETELSVIQLARGDLVRGSEVLSLDGAVAEGGNDYVLDYTGGTLTFVREGVVSTDTRIEIEYEYYDPVETDQVMSAMVNVSPSDDLYIQGDWIRLDREAPEGAGGDSVSNLLALHSEVRRKVAGYDLKLTPGLAFDPEGGAVSGSHLEGLLSSSRVRLQARYEDYAAGYANLYRPQSVIGKARDRVEVFTSTDLLRDLRLTGEWRRVRGFAGQAGASPQDMSGGVSVLVHRPSWPGWEITYQDFETRDEDEATDRHFIQNRVDYQLPASLSRRLMIESVKAEALLRTGKQTAPSQSGPEDQQFRRGQVRLTTSVSDQFQLGFFYRRNDLEDVSPGRGSEPISRSERVLVNVSHEEWRLLQFNLRMENTQDQGYHRGSPIKNVELDQYSQVNLRLSPGRLWNRLSSHHFEFNVNQTTTDASCATDAPVGAWLWRFFDGNDECRRDGTVIRTYSIKNEYRPGPSWFVYSLLERNRNDINKDGSTRQDHDWQWIERVEAKLGFRTRLRLQCRQYWQDRGYERVFKYFEPSVWVEHRWTPDLQNVFNLLYRREKDDEARIKDASHIWDARYDLILRKERALGLRRMELRQSLSGRATRTSGHAPERTYLMTSSSSLDLYPLHSVILRLQFDLTRHLDRLAAENDYTDIALNLRTSFKF